MLRIGSLCLSSPIIVAPLCGISDYPFRQLNREFGAALSYTEMISSVGISRGNKKSLSFTFVRGEHPVVVQLFGNDPTQMADAAKYFEDQGADAIDINLGCSVKKVVKQGAGAALQRDLALTRSVISSVRKSIKIPLLIKCRLGWSRQEENYIELATIAENEGVDAVCLHPRYATQLFSGDADWQHFHNLKKTCTLPLLGSGDVKTSEQMKDRLNNFPITAIMLGRGLVGNPWLLSEYFGKEGPPATAVLRRHADLLLDHYPEKKACALLRKYIAKYTRGHSNALSLRLLGNQLSSARDIVTLIEMIHV